MSDLTPITREEALLDGQDLTPITRQEMFIKHIYDASQEVPTPITREEWFLKKAAEGGGGGDITVESLSVTENGTYTAPSGKAYTPVNVNVPLPANAYLLEEITDGDLTSAKSKPLPSVSVAVTDADELDVFVGDSETVISDNEPYIYRQSKGGRMVSERLVGASVAWNQLVGSSDTSVTVTSGHKYALYKNSTWSVGISDGTAIAVTGGTDMLFDLTLMFGSTIADYIYSLEQTTVGAGIAWLKSYGFFTEDYYAYDSGSLKSVQVSEKKVVGFNQWDEQWELGSIDNDTGQNVTGSSEIRGKNYTQVLPNTEYCFTNLKSEKGVRIYWYDSAKKFVSTAYTSTASEIRFGTRTSPVNAYYVRIRPTNGYGTTYNNDICINISDPSKNGTYEPYKLTTYPLPSSDLRGLYKLSSNKLYCDGDIQYGDGWRLRRYGIVDLGTLTYSYAATLGSNTNLFYTNQLQNDVKHGDTDSYVANAIIAGYETTSRDESNGSSADKLFSINSTGQIQIINHSFNNINAFTAAMSGVMLVYELEIPTWEKTNPFTNPQTVGSTEEFVANLPVGHESKYYDGDIHHSYIYSGDARTKVTGDVDIVNGTALNATCSVCVVMPNGDEIWSDAGDVTAEIWT